MKVGAAFGTNVYDTVAFLVHKGNDQVSDGGYCLLVASLDVAVLFLSLSSTALLTARTLPSSISPGTAKIEGFGREEYR